MVAIDNNAAVERGKVRLSGTDGNQRIDHIVLYTNTWVSWGHGWQIIAAHLSVLPK